LLLRYRFQLLFNWPVFLIQASAKCTYEDTITTVKHASNIVEFVTHYKL